LKTGAPEMARFRSLLDAISELFQGQSSSVNLPLGVKKIERVTSEAVRIQFKDKVDQNLLCHLAYEEGYLVQKGDFTPRVVDKGTIVARVGSQSDPGKKQNIFIYLIPRKKEEMSTYTKAIALRNGVLNRETAEIDSTKSSKHNLKVIRLVERYRKSMYQKPR